MAAALTQIVTPDSRGRVGLKKLIAEHVSYAVYFDAATGVIELHPNAPQGQD